MTVICTLVLWGGCTTVALLGIALPPERFVPVVKKEEPPPVELIKVELTNDPIAEVAPVPADYVPLPLTTPDAPPPPAMEMPPLPQAIPVADPASVEFALPVDGPTQIVPVQQAAYAAPTRKVDKDAPVAPPSVGAVPQRITYGQGQGRQPAPDYPYQAIRRNQTGVVRVRFTVGPDGRVTQAEAVMPCPWSLLNDSAVSTVRHRWRFPAGQSRVYEVDIRFELQDRP